MAKMAKKALGKGLSSIFEDLGTPILNSETESFVHQIPLDKINPNPYQPRVQFDKSEIKDLSQSILNNGLLQPIILRSHNNQYQIVAGERRYRAVKLLGHKTIAAQVREKITDRDMMELSIIENIHRVQLSPLEEAESYLKLVENCGYTHDQLSEKLSKNRTTITNSLRLLKLAAPVKDLLNKKKITAGHARTLVQLPEKQQILFATKIVKEGLNVRTAESLKMKMGQVPKIPKKIDPNLNELLEQIKYSLGAKVSLKGGEEKGKIEIHYNTRAELIKLTNTLRSISPH